MAWKETPRSQATLLRRRYRCEDCNLVFDARHESADEPPPPCPRCPPESAAEPAYIAPMPALNTTKAKAIDLAQQMAEEDYGLTDINDNQRAGDIAYKPPPPMSTAEREREIREMVEREAQVAASLPTGLIMPDGSRGVVSEEQRNVLVDPSMQAANYWQGNAGGFAEQTVGDSATAAAASAAAREQGVDPVGILERGRKEGNMPMRLNVVGRETEIPPALAAAQARRGAMP